MNAITPSTPTITQIEDLNPRKGKFYNINALFRSVAESFRPPDRMTISQAAERFRHLNNPGAYVGKWRNDMVPYMREPMDCLKSRLFSSVVFCGPAQSAKTDALLLNWLLYSVVLDPMDMILYSPTQSSSRDFSMRRVDRLNRFSPAVGGRLVKRRDADNKFDKHYTSGMMLTLSWPSVTEMAGKPVGRIGLTDYDRMPDDVEGDGAPFDLASKRTTTYGSFAMTLAESSPSRPVLDAFWIPTSAHEAPPTTGILGLYNRGDRRRLYWPCPRCNGYFIGQFSHLRWDESTSSAASADSVRLECPLCAGLILPSERAEMLAWSQWLKDGQKIGPNGRVIGDPPRSRMASFWLNGLAAAFVTWQTLVITYLDAINDYERTRNEEGLKKFYNNDLGEPYIPRNMDTEKTPDKLKERAERLPDKMVPLGVNFLVACVDVQKNMFKVQIHGVSPGEPFDLTLIDRYDLKKSVREDQDGDVEWIKPASYLEDWDLITDEVINRTYPLADDSGRMMQIKLTVCDSGGKEGVTTNAYNYYRKLKSEGLAGRFHLVRGEHVPGSPRAHVSFPDSKRKDRMAAARGDVPVLFLNSNILKDDLEARLHCTTPGKGMFRLPDWLADWFFKELCAETKTDKGWANKGGARNEAWDLAYYCIGACVSPLIRVESIDWAKPPAWAEAWNRNSLVSKAGQPEVFANMETPRYDFSKLGATLA